MPGDYQLRGGDMPAYDTGALRHVNSLDEAFELFLQGGYWKLSWTRPNGERIRLVKQGDIIEITNITREVDDLESELEGS